MTCPTDAQRARHHERVELALQAAQSAFPRDDFSQMSHAILAADRAAWVTDGSAPDLTVPQPNKRLMLWFSNDLEPRLIHFHQSNAWWFRAVLRDGRRLVAAWREIIGPEVQS